MALDVLAKHIHFAGSDWNKAQNHFHNGGFSGSIAAQQAVDTPSFHMKINIFYDSLISISFCQLSCFDQIIAHTYFLAFRVVIP